MQVGGPPAGREGGGDGVPGRGERSQAVGCPRQHLHSLVQHLEAPLPVAAVRVAVEEQAVERGAQRQVVLGTCGRRGARGSEKGQLQAAPTRGPRGATGRAPGTT